MLNMSKWVVLVVLVAKAAAEGGRTCEPIEIDYCKTIGYNVTGMPNLFGHEAQSDARQGYLTFKPLIQYGCSNQLTFFLCSVYVPMCTDKVPIPIGPCRPLCEAVRHRCEPTLKDFGFNWPEQLNCSRFPSENKNDQMCMEGPGDPSDEATPPPQPSRRPTKRPSGGTFRKNSNPIWNKPHSSTGQCSKFRSGDRAYVFINVSQRCGQICERDVLFSTENKRFAEIWMAVWSVACFMTSAFTVLLYLMDTAQFESPDRAVVYLCMCYCFQSVGYFIRLLLGRSAASCYSEGHSSVLVHQGLQNHYCSAVFVFIYYFNNAASMWWVVVTITWFMFRPLRYSAEQVRRRMGALHCAAWILPALMTVAILVMKVVDAEELTGVCLVGNQNRDTLLAFIILPQISCLCLGFAFLVSGAVTIYRTKKSKNCHECVNGMAQVSRTWIFAILYVIPACCVLGVNIYEYVNRDSWTLNMNGPISRPYVEYFSFKMLMSVVVGITAGMWTWCSKSPQLQMQESTSKAGNAPPLLVSTPFQHQPIMVQNQYFVPQHLLNQMAHPQQRHTIV